MINYRIENSLGIKKIFLDSIHGPMVIETMAPENAKVSFTATTDMQRSIGKVLSSKDGLSCVDTVWNGRRIMLTDVRDFNSSRIGDAVIVLEHLTLPGQMELISSRVAPDTGDLNFLNLSWENQKVRIDLVTGEAEHASI
jgi:hypothetical protein